MYLILENDDLPDGIAFAYGNSTHAGYRAGALSVRKVDDAEDADANVENSEESFEENDDKAGGIQDSNWKMGSISEKE